MTSFNDCDCLFTRSCYIHKCYFRRLSETFQTMQSTQGDKIFKSIPSLSQTHPPHTLNKLSSTEVSNAFYKDFGLLLQAHPTIIVQASASIRKKLFATFCLDFRVRIWDSSTLELKYIKYLNLSVRRFILKGIKFLRLASHADLVLCLGEWRNIVIWDYKNDTIKELKMDLLRTLSVKFFNDDQDLLICESSNILKILRHSDSTDFKIFKIERMMMHDCCDNRVLFIAPEIDISSGIDVDIFNKLVQGVASDKRNFVVYLLDSNENLVYYYLKCELLAPIKLKVTQDCRLVLIAYKENAIQVLDTFLNSSKIFKFGFELSTQIYFCFENTKLIIIDLSSIVHLWNIGLEVSEKSFSLKNDERSKSLFLLDETKVGIYDELNDVYSIDLVNLEVSHIQGHTNRVSVLETDGKEKFFTGGHDRSLIIWNTNDRKTLIKRQAHDLCISCLGLSTDSHLLFSGSLDAKIKIWKVSNFDLIQEIYVNDLKITQIFVHQKSIVADSDDLTFVYLNFNQLDSIQRFYRVTSEEKILNITANQKFFLSIGTYSRIFVYKLYLKDKLKQSLIRS